MFNTRIKTHHSAMAEGNSIMLIGLWKKSNSMPAYLKWLLWNIKLYHDQKKYYDVLSNLIEDGYVVSENEDYRLTHKGIFWGNTISRELSAMI